MEMSHRSKEYLPIVDKAETSLRTILTYPTTIKYFSYRVGPLHKLHGPDELAK